MGALPQKCLTGLDDTAAILFQNGRKLFVLVEFKRLPMNEHNIRVGFHHSDGTGEGAGKNPVIGGEQERVIGSRPVKPLVVGGNMAAVLGVANLGHAAVALDQRSGHFQGIVRRCVIQDKHADPQAVLVKHAANADFEKAPIAVAGNNDVDRGHLHSSVHYEDRRVRLSAKVQTPRRPRRKLRSTP